MNEQLHAELAARGYQARVIPIHRLAELREEIEGRYQQGQLDGDLYSRYLSSFAHEAPADFPEAKSLILVAVPQPKVAVTFVWEGEEVQFVVPPTYREHTVDTLAYQELEELLAPQGYRVALARVPKKLLATRSGLAVYGRNNISYIPGLGSFFGLVVLFSDLPVGEEPWHESRMMDRCQTCSACAKLCPTGAIDGERFLLHAERCLTFHNEKPSDVPFADWIDPAWNKCLVGCLDCQEVCPENRGCRDWVEEGASFTSEETELLLAGLEEDSLPVGILDKLARSGMAGYAEILPRNLRVLLDHRS